MNTARDAHPIRRLLLAAVLFSAATVRADELKTLLGKPVSPASIALLAPYSADPSVRDRWKAALSNPSPEVRGVAARAAHVCGVAVLLPEIEAALAREKDAGAAREEIRAALSIGDSKIDDTVIAAAARFEGALDGDLVRAFARARGTAALPLYFAKLRNLLLTRPDHLAFLRIASRGGKQSLIGAAAMALGRGDAPLWKLILEASAGDAALAGSPTLQAALASPDSAIRWESAWFLAERFAVSPPAGEAARAAAASLREGEAADAHPGSDAALEFGRELLYRAAGEKPTRNVLWTAVLATRSEGHLDGEFEHGPLVRYLNDEEKASLAKRPPETDSRVDFEKDSDYWSLSHLPKGLGADLLSVSPCGGASGGRYAIAEIAFREDGRPFRVSIVAAPNQSTCDQVVKSAFLLSLAPPDQPTDPDRSFHVQTILREDVLACADEPTRDPVVVRSIDQLRSLITPPEIVSKTDPVYPNLSGRDRVSGAAIFAATVAETGCLTGIHLVRSSGVGSIDIASMLAFLQWKYAPARLHRQPIAFPVAVTFSYKMYD